MLFDFDSIYFCYHSIVLIFSNAGCFGYNGRQNLAELFVSRVKYKMGLIMEMKFSM